MLNIVKGYKQGRAVMFYDLAEVDGSSAREMVSKEEVVNLCSNGEIANAKIQWWEGKAIVRCNNKHLPLVKINDSGEVIGTATQAVRGGEKREATPHTEKVVSVANKAVVAGKVTTKRTKRNISYAGYDTKNLLDKQELSKSINLVGVDTVSDLFDMIAKDFRVQQVDKYKAEFGKKVDLKKKVSDIGGTQLKAIQYGAATYLMNMLYDEVAEVYMKWQ